MPLIESRLRVHVQIAEMDERHQSSFMPWMTDCSAGSLPGPSIHVPDGACYLVRPRSQLIDDHDLRCLAREAERRCWTGISLAGCKRVSSAGLSELRRLGGLRALDLWGVDLGPDDLALLAGLPELEWLRLSGDGVDDLALRHLRHVPRLRHLNLFDTRVTGTGLVHLLPLSALHNLAFNSAGRRERRLADTSLLLLEDLPSLAYLYLYVHGLSDVALASLARCTRLEVLSLFASAMSGYGLRHLAKMERLRCLGIPGMREVGDHLRRLRHLPVRNLDLSRAELSPRSLRALAGTGVEALSLWDLKLDDEAFRPVTALPHLRRLWLCDHPLTDRAMSYLAACERMEDLALDDMDISDGGMWHLSALRRVRRLRLNRLNITEDSLLRLPGMFGLEELDLGLNDIYEEALAVLVNFPHLVHFSLGWGYSWRNPERYQEPASARLTDRGMRHLAPLRRLRYLNLLGTYVTDEGLVHLRELRELRMLHLQGLFTGPGLVHLQGMKALEFLNLEAPLCGPYLAHLRRLPRLGYLLLRDTLITDKDIQHMEALRQVHSLSLDGAAISQRGLLELRQVPTLESLNREDLKRAIAPRRRRGGDKAESPSP